MSKINDSPRDVQHPTTEVPSGAPPSGPVSGWSSASAGAPAAARELRRAAARDHISSTTKACNDLLIMLARDDGTQSAAIRLMRCALRNVHYACEALQMPSAAAIIDQEVA